MSAAAVRRGIVACAVLLILVPHAVLANSSNLGAYIRPVGGIEKGAEVPRFHAKGIYGADLDLEKLLEHDKKIVLAFWSMYCKACIEKFDAMVAIQKKYEYSGLVVISVNTDGEYRKGEQTVRDFIADYEKSHGVKINFPVLYDETNWLALAMNVDFLPTIITVDGEGKVHDIYRRFGEVDTAEITAGIEEIVKGLLGKSAAAPGDKPSP